MCVCVQIHIDKIKCLKACLKLFSKVRQKLSNMWLGILVRSPDAHSWWSRRLNSKEAGAAALFQLTAKRLSLRKGWALSWQANSVTLFVTDDRKICYTHRVIESKNTTFLPLMKVFLLLFNFQFIFIYFLLENHSVTERQCAQNTHQRAVLCFLLRSWLEQLFQSHDTFLPLNTWAVFTL